MTAADREIVTQDRPTDASQFGDSDWVAEGTRFHVQGSLGEYRVAAKGIHIELTALRKGCTQFFLKQRFRIRIRKNFASP